VTEEKVHTEINPTMVKFRPGWRQEVV